MVTEVATCRLHDAGNNNKHPIVTKNHPSPVFISSPLYSSVRPLHSVDATHFGDLPLVIVPHVKKSLVQFLHPVVSENRTEAAYLTLPSDSST